jgi:hypothetical protein
MVLNMIERMTFIGVVMLVALIPFGLLCIWRGHHLLRRMNKKKLNSTHSTLNRNKKNLKKYLLNKKERRNKTILVFTTWMIIVSGYFFTAFGLFLAPQVLDFRGLRILDDPQHKLSMMISGTNPALTDQLRQISTRPDPLSIPFKKQTGALGFYMSVTRTMTTEPNDEVYWHELFHHIWFWKLTEDERNAFRALHELNMRRFMLDLEDTRPFPSRYALTSVEEDWADSGLLFMSGKDNSFGKNIDAERYQLMEYVVRRITNCSVTVVPIARDCAFNQGAYSSRNHAFFFS